MQERELRTQHALELDAVHSKLRNVLAKKDATISALRSELDATVVRWQQTGDELLNEQWWDSAHISKQSDK